MNDKLCVLKSWGGEPENYSYMYFTLLQNCSKIHVFYIYPPKQLLSK